jgi:hypothetical protein
MQWLRQQELPQFFLDERRKKGYDDGEKFRKHETSISFCL